MQGPSTKQLEVGIQTSLHAGLACSAVRQPFTQAVESWNTSQFTSLNDMLVGASAFNQVV
jgi:hypothetical protein